MEKGKALHLYLIIIALALLNCNTTEPPINGKEITLKLEDVSCTEAWISLTITNLQFPTTVTLTQDSKTRSTINLIKADSLLYIDSLLPNTTYKFHVSSILQSSKQNQVSSNEVTTTTMDTTSHTITWQIFTFGEHQHSRLNDVAIIDPPAGEAGENNIFVCGERFVGHWNGVSNTEYPELYRDHRTFYSVSVKGKTVCAVGSDYNGFIYSQAVIALGTMN